MNLIDYHYIYPYPQQQEILGRFDLFSKSKLVLKIVKETRLVIENECKNFLIPNQLAQVLI